MATEPPSLSLNDPSTLTPGNLFCIEPGIGTTDEFYYVEEDVWITERRTELLSKSVSSYGKYQPNVLVHCYYT
jgi:Xaa-Pro aminopeptidase